MLNFGLGSSFPCYMFHIVSAGKLVEQDSTEFIKTEEEEVRQFLKDHEDNSGILDIMHYYLASLAKKYHMKW